MSSLKRLAVLKRSVECKNQNNLLLLLINLLTKLLNVNDVKFEAISSPKEVCRVQQPRQLVTAFNQFSSRYLNVTYVKFDAIGSPKEVCREQQPRQFVTAFIQFT